MHTHTHINTNGKSIHSSSTDEWHFQQILLLSSNYILRCKRKCFVGNKRSRPVLPAYRFYSIFLGDCFAFHRDRIIQAALVANMTSKCRCVSFCVRNDNEIMVLHVRCVCLWISITLLFFLSSQIKSDELLHRGRLVMKVMFSAFF